VHVSEEPILEPHLAICDAHHHLWHHSETYWLDELLADTGSGHRVVSTVFVDCVSHYRKDGPESLRPVGETESMEAVAKACLGGGTRVCAAIVSHADVTLGAAVRPVLESHCEASPRFRGIRHAAAWDADDAVPKSHTAPPPGLLADPTVHAAVRELAAIEGVFEAWCYHPQIPDVAVLARACPNVTIVLNHYGGPLGIGPYAGRPDEVFTDWRRNAELLAECDNVVVKLGGIHMPRNGFGWDEREEKPGSVEIAEATRRYPLTTIDLFGPERCFFESNFPVDRVSCSYRVLWNAFKRIAEGFSADEKALLFHDSAARVYRPVEG
jgi:predicted TIM-barrel fold metal-dependent hydrolase